MAQTTDTWGKAVITPSAFATPTTSEIVTAPGPGVHVHVKVGATATTITVPRPGNHPAGDAVTDWTSGALTSVERIIPISSEFKDPATGNATVQFSQVTGVTWLIVRHNQ